jgi:hypothetical protein
MQLGFCGLDKELWKALQQPQQPKLPALDLITSGFNGAKVICFCTGLFACRLPCAPTVRSSNVVQHNIAVDDMCRLLCCQKSRVQLQNSADLVWR